MFTQWCGIVGNALIGVMQVPLNALDILLMQQVLVWFHFCMPRTRRRAQTD